MKFSPKVIIIGLILVVGVGVSLYVNLKSDTEHDATMDDKLVKHFCTKCATEFEITLANARRDLQSGKGLVCPKCGAKETRSAGAVKKANERTFSPDGDSSEGADDTDTGNSEAKKKPRPTLGNG
jgi:DNA-directed RNA polymerase subunit RPC12/RpoP